MSRPMNPRDPYIGWRERLPALEMTPTDTALVVIDMQYGCASADHGVHAQRRERGLLDGLDYIAERIDTIVPNIARLQAAFRARGMEVVFARICALTQDGRDRSKAHKDLQNHSPDGSREAMILDELAPVGDELVFDKTGGSVFNSTTIHYVLGNLGIRNLVFVGMMTGGCVESSLRDAKDLGYGVIMVSDATGTWTAAMQESSEQVVDEVFGKVIDTDEVLAMLPEPALVRSGS
ncbi:MAG: cysteine hydrolase [Trueperaceae bacterium]|nr:cysteine hydrolase [Trueperaceae bacterium]